MGSEIPRIYPQILVKTLNKELMLSEMVLAIMGELLLLLLLSTGEELNVQVVLVNQAVQRSPADSQSLGGVNLVTFLFFEHCQDVPAFYFPKKPSVAGGAGGLR